MTLVQGMGLDAPELWRAAPPLNGHEFNPDTLVRVVNHLHARGEGEASRIARDRAKALDHPALDADRDYRAFGQLYLVARVLWCPAPAYPAWPELHLGRPDITLPPPDAIWPLSPIVLSNELPFLLVGGYKLGGGLMAATETLERLLAMAQWRARPLSPHGASLDALQSLVDSADWQARVPQPRQAHLRTMLEAQARRAMASRGDFSGRRAKIESTK